MAVSKEALRSGQAGFKISKTVRFSGALSLSLSLCIYFQSVRVHVTENDRNKSNCYSWWNYRHIKFRTWLLPSSSQYFVFIVLVLCKKS